MLSVQAVKLMNSELSWLCSTVLLPAVQPVHKRLSCGLGLPIH